jgi:fermentation-respiration switch protein FrsA (DUF1100 family)
LQTSDIAAPAVVKFVYQSIMLTSVMKVLIFISVSVLLFWVFVRLLESRLVFYPVKYPAGGRWQHAGTDLNLEDCWFESTDGTGLHGWMLRHNQAVATMLWCHGNAGNIAGRLDNLVRLARLPVNVFIFDYRGYGRSSGKPSEAGVYMDAVAAYDYIVSEEGIDADRVVIFGRSLGGAVAVELATQRYCRALILESTFTSASDMAKNMFGFLPVHLVMKSRFDSMAKISGIDAPLLFIHGNQDSIVPYRLGQALFRAANEPKTFFTVEDGDHNDTYVVGGQRYFNRLNDFIQSAVNGKRV